MVLVRLGYVCAATYAVLNITCGCVVPNILVLSRTFMHRIALAAIYTATFIIAAIPFLNTMVGAIRWIVEAQQGAARGG